MMKKSLSRLHRNRKGFTLFELIVTIVILGIMAVPLSLTLFKHLESVTISKDLTQAVNLGRYHVEEMNNRIFTHADLAVGTYNLPNYKGYPYDLTRIVSYTQGSDLTAEGLKKIQVDVKRAGQATPLATFITFVARNVNYGV